MTVVPFTALSGESADARRRAKSAVTTVMLALVVVAAVLPRAGFLARPFASDAGLYIYMGKVLATGQQTLYRDFYETKLPGVPLLTAPLYRAFGNHWWPYVGLQLLMTLMGAAMLAGATGDSGRSANPATFLFALTFLNFSPIAYRGFQLETVQTFFACVSAYAAIRALAAPGLARYVVVGLFAGLAATIKPTGAAVAAAFLFTLLFHRRRFFVALIPVALAALVPATLVLAWTWHAGLLPEMPDLLREISLYASQTPLTAQDLAKPLLAVIIGGAPFLLVRAARPASATTENKAALRPTITFALAWLVLEALGVLAQRRMYAYHFLPLAAPLAVLFGIACRRGGGRSARACAAALAPVLLLSLLWSKEDLAALAGRGVARLPESEWLLAHAAPGDTVVGDPIERLLMETGLACGSRYAHLFYFGNHDAAPLAYGRRFLDDLEERKPAWAVFATDRDTRHKRAAESLTIYALRPIRKANFFTAWEEIEAHLAAHYAPVVTVGDVTIYRRR
jgi:hypothetical protein